MSKIQSAENFAKERHVNTTRIDVNVSHYEHISSVVARLKNLGVTDEDAISAAWLHDMINDTPTSFDEIDQRFGSKVAVLVLSISRDKSLSRPIQEEQFVKQLKGSPLEAKLIKLCDISANLRDLKNSQFSRTRRSKEMKKQVYYLNVIKTDLAKNKDRFPGVVSLVNGINDIISSHGLRPVML
ncbi:MAG TPA: HD domain-containing protein [Candidatus Nitrosotalea sp.]|nr:HD domain-containing protein [Candidatus Nitrosotalea sp.]